MLTARQIINAARDRHAAFDRARIPDAVALRYLSAVQREFAGKITQLDGGYFSYEETVELSPSDIGDEETFDAGWELPEHTSVEGIAVRSTSGAQEVELIPWEMRNAPNTRRLAGYLLGNVLYLRGPAIQWTGATELAVRLNSTPYELEALDDELMLPDAAELAVTERLALFFMQRGHADPSLQQPNASMYQIAARDSEQAFLDSVANRLAGATFRIRETWP